MVNTNQDKIDQWTWMMDDTASYTAGGGAAYRDSLDLLMATALEKDVDPYSLDADTLAHVNQAARYIINNTLDIYVTDDAFQLEQELAEIGIGEQ